MISAMVPPLWPALERRCTNHLCIALRVFICLSEKRGEVSNISAARCGHRRRPSWYFNYRKFRWSPDIIKIGVSPWPALRIPWKIFGKDGTSFYAHTFQIGASHKKDHSFQKETWHFGLQSSVTTSFRLGKKFMVNNHGYTLGLIFWPISGIICYI